MGGERSVCAPNVGFDRVRCFQEYYGLGALCS